ncbi:MAG: ATP-binding cassette domain-containing protein [Oligoflexia bacterium]|nr:ATP-binding cassette domain-containing protein [Oligoflexia bacterium]
MIECKKLSRDFKIFKKKEGFKGTVQSFFKREYSINTAVKDFDLELGSHGLVGLLGPNGSGKTTLMKMLTGIIVPSRGEVKVLSEIPSHRKKTFKKSISLVMGQKAQLWWDIPVMDSFLLFQKYYEIEEKNFKQRVNELGERLNTKKLFQVPVRKLSLGERMKMELMACLLHEPKVIFLDEPTIGLDIVSQKSVRAFLKDYYQEKKPLIVLTSHYMADVEALCEKIVLILEGEKKFEGSIDDFKSRFRKEKTLVFNFEERVQNFPKDWEQDFHCEWSSDRTQIKIRVPEKSLKELVVQILSQFSVSDFHTEKVGVEEVMDEILSGS